MQELNPTCLFVLTIALRQAEVGKYKRFVSLFSDAEAQSAGAVPRSRGPGWLLKLISDVYDAYAAAQAAYDKQVRI